jgi:hypothetical protein
MNDEDRFRIASRLLDDPLVKELLLTIENDAINQMLHADDDEGRREGRDTVLTIRKLRDRLSGTVALYEEGQRAKQIHWNV